MTMIEVTPVPVDSDYDDQLRHIICCLDHDRSMCGAKLNPANPVGPRQNTPDECVVCLDIWDDSHVCPLGPECDHRYEAP